MLWVRRIRDLVTRLAGSAEGVGKFDMCEVESNLWLGPWESVSGGHLAGGAWWYKSSQWNPCNNYYRLPTAVISVHELVSLGKWKGIYM